MCPYILGLTGGIGMGKTTTAASFQRRGIPVLDSDAVVHALYSQGGAAVPAVGTAFPGVVVDGAIDRRLLSAKIVGVPDALRRLEGLVHPLVQQRKRQFLQQAADSGQALVLLDIPLLYETGAEAACDAVAMVSAPAAVQRERVLARPGMSAAKLDGILARQMPDEEKRRRADFVIETGTSLEELERQVEAVLAALQGRQGTAWQRVLAQDA